MISWVAVFGGLGELFAGRLVRCVHALLWLLTEHFCAVRLTRIVQWNGKNCCAWADHDKHLLAQNATAKCSQGLALDCQFLLRFMWYFP